MLQRQVAGWLDRRGVGDCRILVAVSGGVDSSVLLRVLLDVAEERRISLAVGHVNHGLRGRDSDADEAAVGALCSELGLPLSTLRVSPQTLRVGLSSRRRPTPQEAARGARISALRQMMTEAEADWIATGHQADDQAETVMLRLMRGCGPDALAGMADISPKSRILRPLLDVSREDIVGCARAAGIAWREDASNRNLRYARNRLRHRWLPGLAREFNPALLRAIGRLAEAQRRDAEWIDSLVAREAAARIRPEPDGLRIDREGWKALPDALACRLVRRAWLTMGGGRDISRVHLDRMLAMLRDGRPGTTIELPGGFTLNCRPEAGLLRIGG